MTNCWNSAQAMDQSLLNKFTDFQILIFVVVDIVVYAVCACVFFFITCLMVNPFSYLVSNFSCIQK